ncbi:MAG: hypothetical protein IPP81_04325 [Chitinophagaceae bacterium]|nr:hypothetical protein [Chitinophagaceae bacterium]
MKHCQDACKRCMGSWGRSAEKLAIFGISNAWQLRNMSEDWGGKIWEV